MRKSKVQLSKYVTVNVPNLPNFIHHEVPAGGWVPVHMFTERELRKVGKAWTDALVKLAAKKKSQEDKQDD